MLTADEILGKLDLIKSAQPPGDLPPLEPGAEQDPAPAGELPPTGEQPPAAGPLPGTEPAGPSKMSPEQAAQLAEALRETTSSEDDDEEDDLPPLKRLD